MTTRSPTFSNVNAAVVCTAWKPFERNTLKGFADFWLRAVHLNIRGCAVHEKNGERWVQLPAKPKLDQNQALARDEGGKFQYARVLAFGNARAVWWNQIGEGIRNRVAFREGPRDG